MTADRVINICLALAWMLSIATTIYFLPQRKRKEDSEIHLTQAQERQMVSQIESSQEQKFNAKVEALELELVSLKRYVNEHMPWDWKAVRALRLNGIEIEDPPTLFYIKEADK